MKQHFLVKNYDGICDRFWLLCEITDLYWFVLLVNGIQESMGNLITNDIVLPAKKKLLSAKPITSIICRADQAGKPHGFLGSGPYRVKFCT